MDENSSAVIDEWQALYEQDPDGFNEAIAALSAEEYQEVKAAMELSVQEEQAQLEELRAENERRRLWAEHYEREAGKWGALS